MSVNQVLIKCERCDTSFSRDMLNGLFVYQLQDGRELPLERALGWCDECDRAVAMEDLSGANENKEMAEHAANKRDAESKLKASMLSFLMRGERQRLEYVNKQMAQCQEKLDYLAQRSAPPRCLTCSSTNVRPLPYPPWPQEGDGAVPAGWEHPGCGGKMYAVNTGRRFSYAPYAKIYDEEGLRLDDD